MWQLIERNNGYPPTRAMRYCCAQLKERGGEGRHKVTGIRAEESPRRAKRKMIEKGRDGKTTFYHIIRDWSKGDVWEYIHKHDIPYCKLYDEGFERIGCILCPFAGKHREIEMKRWPKYVELYKRAMARGRKAAEAKGKKYYNTVDEAFAEWLELGKKKTIAESCDSVPLFSEDDGEAVL